MAYGEEWNWPSDYDDQGMAGFQEEEDGHLSLVQRRDVARKIMDFLDIFIDSPRVAKGWDRVINTSPGVAVKRTPLHPILLGLQKLLKHEVDKMLQMGGH